MGIESALIIEASFRMLIHQFLIGIFVVAEM